MIFSTDPKWIIVFAVGGIIGIIGVLNKFHPGLIFIGLIIFVIGLIQALRAQGRFYRTGSL